MALGIDFFQSLGLFFRSKIMKIDNYIFFNRPKYLHFTEYRRKYPFPCGGLAQIMVLYGESTQLFFYDESPQISAFNGESTQMSVFSGESNQIYAFHGKST